MEDLKGKVAFITGGASGIGLGIARAALDVGMRVAITYRRNARSDLTLQHLGALLSDVLVLELDVTDRSSMHRAADAAAWPSILRHARALLITATARA